MAQSGRMTGGSNINRNVAAAAKTPSAKITAKPGGKPVAKQSAKVAAKSAGRFVSK
jgi:hypothetical protein